MPACTLVVQSLRRLTISYPLDLDTRYYAADPLLHKNCTQLLWWAIYRKLALHLGYDSASAENNTLCQIPIRWLSVAEEPIEMELSIDCYAVQWK